MKSPTKKNYASPQLQPSSNNQIKKNNLKYEKKVTHTLILALKSRKVQITEKEDSVKEIARYTHLLFALLLPVLELHATESLVSKDKIMKNVYLISYLT